jgi:hypothetical protein
MDNVLHTHAEQNAEHDQTDFPHHDWVESGVCTENEHISKTNSPRHWNPIAYWQRYHAWSIVVRLALCRLSRRCAKQWQKRPSNALLCSQSAISKSSESENVLTKKYLLACCLQCCKTASVYKANCVYVLNNGPTVSVFITWAKAGL